ncbi:hypothetical protein V5799_027590 [Amblyomma americanum]|uniref:Uncharacterized protein n=1 Tax=Amblyomma americanum TaxID=6943 RepID=A0AAQ4DFA3_AMBAM
MQREGLCSSLMSIANRTLTVLVVLFFPRGWLFEQMLIAAPRSLPVVRKRLGGSRRRAFSVNLPKGLDCLR